MPSTLRRLGGAVCAATLVAALAACQDDEPEATTSSTGPSGGTTRSAAPTGCDGAAAPKFSGADQAYESVARVDAGRAVGVQSSEPTLSKDASGIPGWSIARITVRAAVVTNGVFALGPDSFSLVDDRGRQCTRPRTAGPSPLAISEIDEKKSATGSVSFLVPAEADLNTFRVLYGSDPSGAKPEAQWSSKGSAPTGAGESGCSNQDTRFRLASGVDRTPFGDDVTVGGDSGSRVEVGTPKARTLKPSERHPNDVDGLAVPVKVTALGTSSFIDRSMFQMVDDKNKTCAFSALGTEGENLSSDFVPAGQSRSYTLIFWVPKGEGEAAAKRVQVLFREQTDGDTFAAGWYDKGANPPTPGASPSSGAPSSSASSTATSSAATSSPATSSPRPSAGTPSSGN